MQSPFFAPRRHDPAEPGDPPSQLELPLNNRVATIFGRHAGAFGRSREVTALALWVGALFLTIALGSYSEAGHLAGNNLVGPVGDACAHALITCIGVVAWGIPFEFALLGVPLIAGRRSVFDVGRVAGDLLLVFVSAALIAVASPGRTAFGGLPASGVVGELFGEVARSLFSTAGSFIIGFAIVGLILISRAAFSFIAFLRFVARISLMLAAVLTRLANRARSLRPQFLHGRVAIRPTRSDRSERGDRRPDRRPDRRDDESPSFVVVEDDASEVVLDAVSRAEEVVPLALTPTDSVEAKAKRAPRAKKAAVGPTIVDTSAALEREAISESDETSDEASDEIAVATAAPSQKKRAKVIRTSRGFELPSIDFLSVSRADPSLIVDREVLIRNADLLVKTLSDYGVQGKVEDILPGPTVTTYEVSPAAGTKVSKVASLADDLALALARKVRIVAPIPGKNRIGFELPNDRRTPVNLRDLIEDRRFHAMDAPLPVVLGRDILGNPVYTDLATMPHVIVAGATGAGKSVGLNVMLASLLYRRTPDELRLLMIDPKVVELAPYDRIPHMLLPVVTDMKQASNALKWAVDEMERRYQLFADAGTKNIGTFNGWVGRVRRGETKNLAPKVVIATDHNGLPEIIRPDADEKGEAPLPEVLPFIVIIVDEFADLMMQQGKEVEAAVARLAQKARAAGMHVILATQRPSVDVITGMIKANFPTRIAFRVAQKVDSRTILDEQGAEHLLGRGDMLIKLNGTNEMRRVQCPWVSEEEVQRITDHLRAQGEPVYDENILKPRDEDGEIADQEDAEQDALYDDAVRLVADTRRCSTSWLQRKLGLGYNRAARIVEMMERRGLVGPANGSRDREVLVGPL